MNSRLSLLVIVFLLSGNLALSQESDKNKPTDSELKKRIEAYIAPMEKAGQLSGSFLVARGDKILFEKSWGFADRQRKIAFDSKTSSCVASVSKPVTVILAVKLLGDGKISLRDPISKWLKDFPNGDKIQVQHLLYHRSGIPHRLTKPDEENIARTAADMVELASKAKLDFEPGSRNQYSSGGYSVLVRVLELASGKSYQQLLDEIVLKPLQLKNTFHPGPKTKSRIIAKSYRWTLDGQTVASEKDYSFLVGAGSLFSTPRDMLAISRALTKEKFGELAKRRLTRFGRLQWNGITNHYRAYLNYNSQTDVTVVMVSNNMVGANDSLRVDIPRIVKGEEVKPRIVPNHKRVSLPEDVLKQYAGRYNIGGSPMPVRAQNGALYANDWLLIPISEKSFFSPQDYSIVSVTTNDKGEPQSLDWGGLKCKRLGPLK